MVHHVIDGIFIRNIKLTGLDTGGTYLFQSVHAPSAGNQGHSLSHIPPLFLFPALTYTACVRWGTVVQIPGPYTYIEVGHGAQCLQGCLKESFIIPGITMRTLSFFLIFVGTLSISAHNISSRDWLKPTRSFSLKNPFSANREAFWRGLFQDPTLPSQASHAPFPLEVS